MACSEMATSELQHTVRNYLLAKPEAQEDFPFYPHVAVMKVQGKMFATLSPPSQQEIDAGEDYWRMNLKCDPQQAIELRDVFRAVVAGYHMNKKHWNTVWLDGEIPMGELERMIDHSYALVVKGLTKAQRRSLETQYSPLELFGEQV